MQSKDEQYIPNKKIIDLGQKVDREYLNAPLSFFLTKNGTKAATEKQLNLISSKVPDMVIFVWLKRIEHSFIVGKQSKSNGEVTNKKILEFLQSMQQFPEEIQRFLTTDKHLLNCLLYSLLLSNNPVLWQQIIELIEKYNPDSQLIVLASWYKSAYLECAIYDYNLVIQSLSQGSVTYRLPDSPISKVFTHTVLSFWYKSYPNKTPGLSLSFLLAFVESSEIVRVFAGLLEEACLILHLTNYNPVREEHLEGVRALFLTYFRLEDDQRKHVIDYFNTPQFRMVLNKFLPMYLNEIDRFGDKEHILGLAHLIIHYQPLPIEFLSQYQIALCTLTRKLFHVGFYKEAYEIIDYLHITLPSLSTIQMYTALFCFAYNIEKWLNSSRATPEFNEKEHEIISRLTHIVKELDKDTPRAFFREIATKLAKTFEASSNRSTRNACKKYYDLIVGTLTKFRKDELDKLFKTPIPSKSSSTGDLGLFAINKASIAKRALPRDLIYILEPLEAAFPEAEFYLTGVGPVDIVMQRKPNDYDIAVLNLSREKLLAIFNQLQVTYEVRGKKNPIVYCPLANNLSADFTIIESDSGKSAMAILKKDYLKRDFNICSMYIKLEMQQNSWPVFSFNEALNAWSARRIITNNDATTTIRKDPTRLARLAKLSLRYAKSYQLGPSLRHALEQFKGNWINLLNSYVAEDRANKSRLCHAWNKLFARHEFSEINQLLDDYGILKELTGLSLAKAEAASKRIPLAIPAEDRLLFWVMAGILQNYEDGTSLLQSPAEVLLSLSPLKRDYLEFVHNHHPEQPEGVMVFTKEVVDLVSAFDIPKNQLTAQVAGK